MAERLKSRDERIREAFAAVGGGMGTASFARHCLIIGIWSMEERDQMELRAAQAEIRKALKKADISGLPFAGQTTVADETGAQVWQQRALWLYDDYELNIGELISQRDETHWSAVALCDECRQRYGRAPEIGMPGDAIAGDRAAD